MSRNEAVARVEQILSDLGMPADRNVAFPWIDNRAPLGEIPVPPRVRYRLMAIHARLGGDWTKLEEKRRAPLPFDFAVDDRTLIEVEPKFHFSSARLTTLEFYDELEHNLDLALHRELCDGFAKTADRYQATREATDFPFPGGRSAQRAYFDTAKDLLAAANGYRLIRIPAADAGLIEDIDSRLRVLL